MADLSYLLDRKAREAVTRNLRQVLKGRSESMIRYEALWTFRNFAKYVTEFFRFNRLGAKWFDTHVLIKGKENLKEAAAAGKGVIVLTAHLGNWELGSLMLAELGYRVTSVALYDKNERVNKLLNNCRARRGVELLSADGFLRGCYRALRDGKVLALLGDRDVTGGGIEMEFFGKPVSLPQGPARLSVRTGAPILPGFLIRRPNDSWHAVIEKPIFPDQSIDQDEAVRSIMEKYVPVMEDHIRWRPSQWSVFYDYWKTDDE